MVKLIALYKKPADPAAFDKHYFEVHLPLAKKMPGLRRAEVNRVAGTPMGTEAPYHLTAELCFDDMAALKAAMSSPEGKAAAKDIMAAAGGIVSMMVAEVA